MATVLLMSQHNFYVKHMDGSIGMYGTFQTFKEAEQALYQIAHERSISKGIAFCEVVEGLEVAPMNQEIVKIITTPDWEFERREKIEKSRKKKVDTR